MVLLWKLSVISLVFLTIGCAKPNKTGSDYEAIEKASSYLEKFGSISISPPLLTKPQQSFKFDLSNKVFTADKYFKDAKEGLQGKASILSQRSLTLGVGGSAQIDPTQTAAFEQSLKQFNQKEHENKSLADVQRQRNKLIDNIAEEELTFQLEKARELESLEERSAAVDTAISQYNDRKSNINTSANAYPGLSENNVPDLADPTHKPEGKKNFTSDKFKDYQKLLSDKVISITDREALSVAQGDNAMEAIFRLFGDANEISTYDQVFYAVSIVSVNPGWLTSRGYRASLSVVPEVEFVKARKEIEVSFSGSSAHKKITACINKTKPLNNSVCEQIKDKPNNIFSAASITAVSPLSTVRSHELGNSQRDQIEFALQLALALRSAGQNIQAKVFLDYAKSIQKDYSSISADNSISISSSGTELSVEIGPVFQAIRTSGADESAGGHLQRQSFPVLFIVGLRKADFPPVDVYKDQGGSFQIMEPVLKFTQRQQWYRNQESMIPYASTWKRLWHTTPERDSMEKRLKIRDELYNLKNKDKYIKQLARALRLKVSGSYTKIPLSPSFIIEAPKSPNPKKMMVEKVIPASVKLKIQDNNIAPKSFTFTFTGKNLDKVKKVSVNRDLDINKSQILRLGDNAIGVKNISIMDVSSPLIFFFEDGNGKVISTFNLPVSIQVVSPPSPQAPVLVSHQVKKEGGTTTQTVKMTQGVKGDLVKSVSEIFKSEIEKGKKMEAHRIPCCGK